MSQSHIFVKRVVQCVVVAAGPRRLAYSRNSVYGCKDHLDTIRWYSILVSDTVVYNSSLLSEPIHCSMPTFALLRGDIAATLLMNSFRGVTHSLGAFTIEDSIALLAYLLALCGVPSWLVVALKDVSVFKTHTCCIIIIGRASRW